VVARSLPRRLVVFRMVSPGGCRGTRLQSGAKNLLKQIICNEIDWNLQGLQEEHPRCHCAELIL
jgi:hypothetical protein